MTKLFFILSLLYATHGFAAVMCETTCNGVTDKIIDAYFSRYALDSKFEKSCQEKGGTVTNGGSGDSIGFDYMNCLVPDSERLHGGNYYYCVIEQKVQATGMSVNGGDYASYFATDACRANLGNFHCTDKIQTPARGVVYGETVCHNIKFN